MSVRTLRVRVIFRVRAVLRELLSIPLFIPRVRVVPRVIILCRVGAFPFRKIPAKTVIPLVILLFCSLSRGVAARLKARGLTIVEAIRFFLIIVKLAPLFRFVLLRCLCLRRITVRGTFNRPRVVVTAGIIVGLHMLTIRLAGRSGPINGFSRPNMA